MSSADHDNAGEESITDGDHDIAMTTGLSKMKVQAKGRMKFQHVFLWASSRKGLSNIKYEPGDAHDSDYAPLPSSRELRGKGSSTIECLEVGLIIGSDPGKWLVTGRARDREREAARKALPDADRDETALRVFTRVTEHPLSQTKFLVGVQRKQGRLYARRIANDLIFFYPEFWTGVDDQLPGKERTPLMLKAVKYAAANNKDVVIDALDEPTNASLGTPEISSPSVKFPRSQHYHCLVAMWNFMSSKTKERKFVELLRRLCEYAASDLAADPGLPDGAIYVFYDYSMDYTIFDAQVLCAAIESMKPGLPKMDIALLVAVRSILGKRTKGVQQEVYVGDLTAFLHLCHLKLDSRMTEEVMADNLKRNVYPFLEVTRQNRTPGFLSCTSEAVGPQRVAEVLQAVLERVEQLLVGDEGEARAVIEQHLAMLPDQNMDALMEEAMEAFGVGNFQMYVKHMVVLLAHQAMPVLRGANGDLDGFYDMIKATSEVIVL